MEVVLFSILAGLLIMLGFTLIVWLLSAIVIVGYKNSIYWLAAVCVAISAITITFIGVTGGLCVFLVLLVFCYTQSYCMSQELGFIRSVIISMTAFIVGLAASYFIIRYTYGEIYSEYVEKYINNISQYIKDYISEIIDIGDMDVIEVAREYILMTVPSIVVIISLLFSLSVYSCSASLLNRKYKEKIRYVRFEYWELPPNVGCFMTIAFFLVFFCWSFNMSWAGVIMMLLMSIYIFSIAVQGACSIIFYQKVHSMPIIPAWIILGVVISAAPVLVLIVGFIDRVFRLRFMYMVRHGMVKLKKINLNDPSSFRNNFNGFGPLNNDDNGEIIHDVDEDSNNYENENHNEDEKTNNDDKESNLDDSDSVKYDENENNSQADDSDDDKNNDNKE